MQEQLKWAVAIALSVVLGGAIVVGLYSLDDNGSTAQPASVAVQDTPAPAQTSADSQNQAAEDNDFEASVGSVADLYEQVRASVVRINARAGANVAGVGSGIIIDDQGHILTNNHVVANAGALDVVLADGTSASAEVVGRDPGNDLAVIRTDIAPDLLQPAQLGDSSTVRVGEAVIAVGNPFGLEGGNSVTEGIVSGLGRRLGGSGGRPLRQLIQADAAINPGNSGGALFNSEGEVIGVTTAIENPSGDRVFVGVGYAVPINVAERFLPRMIAGETVQHPRLGIALEDVTPSVAETQGLNVDHGVIIRAVGPGTAADAAGLQGGTNGDIIIGIDGEEVRNFEDLADYIDTRNVGDVVDLTIVRGGQEMSVQVTLEAWQQLG